MTASTDPFSPLSIANGRILLKHRIVMAPMTRSRGIPLTPGTPDTPNRIWLPDEMVAQYYGQRSSPGGLLITEGIPPSLQASAMPGVPGIFHESQITAWRRVTDAVHAKGGYIYAQLWHAGRATIPQMTGCAVVSSASTPWDDDEKFPFRDPVTNEKVAYRAHPPKGMTDEDMQQTIEDFVRAAEAAVGDAGFDGVEINGGNGNLLDQFLHSNINTRTDSYGGSPEARCKFPLDLIAAVVSAVGPSNLAVRMEPTGIYNHTRGAERVETWSYFCHQLAETYSGENKLSYIHFIEPRFDRIDSAEEKDRFYASWSLGPGKVSNAPFRDIFSSGGTPCFSCGGWDGENVQTALEGEPRWDAVVFAKWFVSNPDLPDRLRKGVPLHPYDRSRFYGAWDGNREKGYVDYPTYEEEIASKLREKEEV